jgi:hypothetical protein
MERFMASNVGRATVGEAVAVICGGFAAPQRLS